jgi:fatty aldehyde-generating acyl-ACP reductase
MERFAFIIHPMDPRRDLARLNPLAAAMPDAAIELAYTKIPPFVASHIVGIKSKTGAEAEGWFIACPMTPKQLLGLPPEDVYAKLQKCCELAEARGAKIIGLGALTSVAGDGGITLSTRTPLAVTTGNSYTVATAVEGARRGAALMDVAIGDANVAVVGAAGSIGRTSALLLAPDARKITLIGRDTSKLAPVAAEVEARGGRAEVCGDVAEGLREADVIVTVTSAADAVIHPKMLVRGAVVVDVARPRDVSVKVAKERPDVLVIEGGLIDVPGNMRCLATSRDGSPKDAPDFSFGFPPGTAYACMSETMMLALDGRYESLTLGKTVSVEQAQETVRLAEKHGFKLGGFRSFEQAVTEESIAAVRRAAGRCPRPKDSALD